MKINQLQSISFCCLLTTLLLWSSRILAEAPPTVDIDDGGVVVVQAGTYLTTFASTTADNNSTALLETAGLVSLVGTFDAFYGELEPQDGSTLDFKPTGAVNPAKATVGGASYTSATTFVKQGGAYSLTGSDASSHSVVLGPYGVLDLTDSLNTGDLTLSQALYIQSASGPNAGYIKFQLGWASGADTTKKLVIGTGNIATDQSGGVIDVSKNIQVDFSKIVATGLAPNPYTFTLATGTSDFATTGTLSPAGNDDGLWTAISVLQNSGGHNIQVQATFAPTFLTSSGAYEGTFADLASASGTTVLEKNTTLSSSQTIGANLKLDLGNFTLGTSGGSCLTIASGKIFALCATGTGTFGGNVCFANNTSTLQLCSPNILTGSFSASTSSASGNLVIGDGTTTVTQTLATSQLRNIGTVQVKANATLTLTSAS